MSARQGATCYEVRRVSPVRSARPSRWIPSICWPRRRVHARRPRRRCQPRVTGAAYRGRRGCRLCPCQLPCRRYRPCKESLLLTCRGGQPPGTAAWGFNSAFMVIWAVLRGRGGGAENAGQL